MQGRGRGWVDTEKGRGWVDAGKGLDCKGGGAAREGEGMR